MENNEYRIAIITLSDRAYSGEREDISGVKIREYLEKLGYSISSYSVLPDDGAMLEKELIDLADRKEMDLVLTTGGTGLAPRDITPEVTLKLATKVVPGIAEAIRAYSLTKTKNAMLSRGVAAIRNRTLIINFAGSPKACIESLDAIIEALPHALGTIRGEKLDS